MATNKLKGKKILITAGPTWVPIDKVRVITNFATGTTGLVLTERLRRLGARVKLLLGPLGLDTLSKQVENELKSKKYDIVIHSAAVADYKVKHPCRGKIKSGVKALKLGLIPTKKIIDAIKRISPGTTLVGFKFEPDATKEKLIKEARGLMCRSSCDLVVANTSGKHGYYALIIGKDRICGPYRRKQDLAKHLIGHL